MVRCWPSASIGTVIRATPGLSWRAGIKQWIGCRLCWTWGHLASLGERISQDDPNAGDLTVAYQRDASEPLKPASSFASIDEYYHNGKGDLAADYLYLYENGRWLVCGLYNDPDWIEMQVIIGKEQ